MLPENESEKLAALAVGEGAVALFSLTGRERLERQFRRLDMVVIKAAEAAGERDVLVVNADFVFEERVIIDLSERRLTALIAENEDGRPVVVAAICSGGDAARWADLIAAETPASDLPKGEVVARTVAEVSGLFNRRLRKREEAMAVKATATRRNEIERRMFKGSYKGATDIVTKFVLPEPALHATRFAAALKLSPNVITSASLILVFATIFLFMRGDFLAGAAVGWLMCFLDTVDGKLARVTLQSSKFGNIFDHGIDLIHPPFWYWAWAYGIVNATPGVSDALAQNVWTAMWVVNGGYVVNRLLEGYFVRRFKIEIHIWRPIDYWFRHITARRNPNLLMLTICALFGAPALGLFAVMAWTIVSMVFHTERIIEAEYRAFAGKRGAPLRSWLAE